VPRALHRGARAADGASGERPSAQKWSALFARSATSAFVRAARSPPPLRAKAAYQLHAPSLALALRAAARARASRLLLPPRPSSRPHAAARRAMAAAGASGGAATVWWLRKGLRLHDNPALLAVLEGASAVHPLFILDPTFLAPASVGGARLRFLLESLADVDAQLRQRNSRLIVLHGARVRVPVRQAAPGCAG
jgi:hypothetical protein